MSTIKPGSKKENNEANTDANAKGNIHFIRHCNISL